MLIASAHKNVTSTLEVSKINYSFNLILLTELHLETVSFILSILTYTKIFKFNLLSLAESPHHSSTVDLFVTFYSQLLLNRLNFQLMTLSSTQTCTQLFL